MSDSKGPGAECCVPRPATAGTPAWWSLGFRGKMRKDAGFTLNVITSFTPEMPFFHITLPLK